MIAVKKNAPETTDIRRMIDVDLLDECPLNPRKTFDDSKIQELADSMRPAPQGVGQLQSILVRPSPTYEGRYEIAAGHRRKRAAELAGLEQLDAVVRELSDAEMIAIGLTEAGHQEPLPPLEEADAYAALKEKQGWSVEQISDRIGKSMAHVHRRLRLTHLCEEARQAVRDGWLLANAAALLARLESFDEQRAVVEKARAEIAEGDTITRDDIDRLIGVRMRVLVDAYFDVDDTTLHPTAGACGACPKRTGAQALLFGEAADDKDRCVDGDCWGVKLATSDGRLVEAARAKGLVVLSPEDSKKVFPHGTWPAHPYITLDDVCYVGHEAGTEPRTWRQVLGDKAEPIIAFDGDGRPREVLTQKSALAAAGFTTGKANPPASPPPGGAYPEDNDDFGGDEDRPPPRSPPTPAHIDTATTENREKRDAIVAAIVERVEDRQDAPVWVFLKCLLLGVLDLTPDWEDMARRRGLSAEVIEDKLNALTPTAELAGLVVELIIGGPFSVEMRDLALHHLGMDEAEILAAARAKAAAKKSARAKKEPAKKPAAKKAKAKATKPAKKPAKKKGRK